MVLASGGSHHPRLGITYAAEIRAFGVGPAYHSHTSSLGRQIIGRLPERYGHESSTIHTAEVIGALIALRGHRTGSQNLLVVDRSAFSPS